MLNIYQIMSFHHIAKQIVTDFSKVKTEPKSNSLLVEFQNLLSIIFLPNKNEKVEAIYNISGE